MKKIVILWFLILTLFPSITAQKVGLVLSGGGAKGAAHIGVIKALEENNIPIDYITGTSVGAIIGSLYATGYSPDEMLELMLSDEFGYWQTGTVKNEDIYYVKKPDITPEFTHFSVDLNDSLPIKTNLLPSSLINPIQMNQAFMELYAQASAKANWNFDNLFIPFRCTGSDVYNKKSIVFRNGDLGDAVRTSMTFPLIFKPLWRDSVPLFDGGIYDNFPIHPMREAFSPDFIFGSTVVGTQIKPSENPYNQIEMMIMQKTEYDIPEEEGMMVKFKFPTVSLLDFHKAKELMEIGYNHTLTLIDSIKQRVPREVTPQELNARRKAYRATLPPLVFKNMYISGVTEAQRKYIEAQLHRDKDGNFSMDAFRRAYFKMLTYSKIKEMVPHAVYNRREKKFDLYLEVKIKEELSIGFGGNVSSHQANQLFLGLGYQTLSHYAADMNANFQVGNAFDGISLNGRLFLQTRIPTYINVEAVYANKKYLESQSLFYEDVVPAIIKQKESYSHLKIGFPLLNKAKAEIGFAYGQLNDYYFQASNRPLPNATFDHSVYDLFCAQLNIERNTLDTKQYATNGKQLRLTAHYTTGTERYKPSPASLQKSFDKETHTWLKVKAHWQQFYAINSYFSLGHTSEMVISSKKLLNNYTASVLQAPAFTPTPHSQIVFNEAFRANQYLAGGISPILKISKRVHLRADVFAFAPLHKIQRYAQTGEDNELDIPYYGKLLDSFQYMGEAAFVVHLPFACISLYANGYSYPTKNINVGLNIGYLIFNRKMLD